MTKGKKNSAFMKPVQPSKALAEIVGSTPIPRTEVTKKVWDYIKKHKLQDQANKRNIIADPKLGAVLDLKPGQTMDMFEMTRKISKHLKDAPEMAGTR